MKMRMGYHHAKEILKVLPILDKFPLKNLAIHARIGKQLYKGGVDLESFQCSLDATKHKMYYNGDITSIEAFRALQRRFPSIDHWMIGRGILADPFLAQMIKEDTEEYPEDALEVFFKYHDTLLDEFTVKLKGEKQIIQKMGSYWEYLQHGWLIDETRIIKKLRKSKTLDEYSKHLDQLTENLEDS